MVLGLQCIVLALVCGALTPLCLASSRLQHQMVQGEEWRRTRSAAGLLGPMPKVYAGQFDVDDVHWWKYGHSDCPLHRLRRVTVAPVFSLKALCLDQPACAGFTSDGWLLRAPCARDDMHGQPGTDVYVWERRAALDPAPPAAALPPVWPMPKALRRGERRVAVDSAAFVFQADPPNCTDLTAAFARFHALMFPHATRSPAVAALREAQVRVAQCPPDLQLHTDESYRLQVPLDGSIRITAPTHYGAYHALETLAQLVTYDHDAHAYYIRDAPVEVDDAPRFAHREVLLDSARHFLAVPTLKSIIASLPYAKINVVHWHIVDTESFPVDSRRYPELARHGAFSAQERYSPADLAEVVEFARLRGVRVMLEVDTPGHARSWCAGHPEVCPARDCKEPLNVANNATFELIEGLLRELTTADEGLALFPERLLHLGGDEVRTHCWTSVPQVAQWMQSRGFTAKQAYKYFVERVQGIARALPRDVVGWEEIWEDFGPKLDKRTIIHQWLPGSKAAPNVTAHGYRLLWSTDFLWYLDHLDTTWQTMYAQEPCLGVPDAQCKRLVLGGGGEMWGEAVDASNILTAVWPRLAAIAERLWSPRDVTGLDAAGRRLAAFRCLLTQRGVPAAPVGSTETLGPLRPGSCYT